MLIIGIEIELLPYASPIHSHSYTRICTDFFVAVVVLLRDQLAAVCFDEEFARARGLRVDALFVTLLVLTALTTVLLVLVSGIVMMLALLTIPAAIAGRFAGRLSHMMIGGALLTALFTFTGLAVSYSPELPAGATIVAITGAAYLIVIAVTRPQGGPGPHV